MKKKNVVDLKNITVKFDDDVVLDDMNLSIKDGEFVTLLGASGCGKTTTLRIIAGFVQPDSGDVLFEGERINEVPAHKRSVNTIFQKYALFPNYNVYDNIAFGLRISKVPEPIIKERVAEMLKLVNLEGFEKRSVDKLSGGQQQRVAIARAMINRPQVLFCDEPTGNLDRKNADEVLELLLETKALIGQTLIMVTHDMSIADKADKIYIMDDGQLSLFKDKQGFYRNTYEADMKRAKEMNEHVIKPN